MKKLIRTLRTLTEKEEQLLTEKEMYGNFYTPDRIKKRDIESARVAQWCLDHPDKVLICPSTMDQKMPKRHKWKESNMGFKNRNK